MYNSCMLAEELLLLLTDDVSGKLQVKKYPLNMALAGAVLADLMLSQRISIKVAGLNYWDAQITVVNDSSTGDPILDTGLQRISPLQPGDPRHYLSKVAQDLHEEILEHLVQHGVLRVNKRKTFGIISSQTWTAVRPELKQETREGLRSVLKGQSEPSPEQLALIALLYAVDQVRQVLADSGKEAVELHRVAGQFAEGDLKTSGAITPLQVIMFAVGDALDRSRSPRIT